MRKPAHEVHVGSQTRASTLRKQPTVKGHISFDRNIIRQQMQLGYRPDSWPSHLDKPTPMRCAIRRVERSQTVRNLAMKPATDGMYYLKIF